MPDIFDQVASDRKGDIFDEVAKPPALRPPTMTERISGGAQRMLGNLPGSAMNYMAGMVDSVAHPGKTLSAIGAIPVGLYEKAGGPTPESWGKPGERQAERQLDAMGNHLKQRYGGLSNIAETAQTDPVGFAGDVATVAGVAGSLPGRVGKYGAAVSEAANPMVGPARGVGAAVSKAIPKQWAAEKAADLYQSSLKVPPSWHSPDELKSMVNTAMDEGVKLDFIPSSGKALKTVRGKIDAINSKVKGAVQEGAAEGKAVDPTKVAESTRRSQEAFTTVDPADRAPIDALKKRFIEQNSVDAPYTKVRPGSAEEAGSYVPEGEGVRKVPVDIPLDKAQRLKQNTYRELRDSAYGEQVGALREGKKDLAHGLMQGVYDQLKEKYPDLATLGQKEKVLIDLEDALERFVTRHGNRDQFSLKTIAAHDPVAAIANAVYDNPGIKSRIAIALRRASQNKRAAALNPTKRQAVNVAASVVREEDDAQQ